MLTDEIDEPSAAALYRSYREELGGIVDDVGADRAVSASGIDPATVEAIDDPDAAVSLDDAAAILALRGERPAEELLSAARDELLFGMSAAVVDVEAIAAGLDGLDPGEVQAKVEGRYPMTLREFAAIRYAIQAN